MDLEKKKYQIDFHTSQSLAFSFPFSYRFYRKQEKQVGNWKDLYASILQDLARSYPAMFELGSDNSIVPENELGDLKQSKKNEQSSSYS